MKYISTRGSGSELNFTEILRAGLASDGGLYVPKEYIKITNSAIMDLKGSNYSQVAEFIIGQYLGLGQSSLDIVNELSQIWSCFSSKSVVPVHQISSNIFLAQMYHGPSASFKDIALQFMSLVVNQDKNSCKKIVIVATSGDTGSAAIEAFRKSKDTLIFILYPQDGISCIQRRQMTTVNEKNIFPIAVEGTFDDCQTIVKKFFADKVVTKHHALIGLNSINFARILAQIVYYFTIAITLGAPNRKVNFVVPTGNCGNVYAGYIAKQMGLNIGKLNIATNRNHILYRVLKTGEYRPEIVHKSLAPAMDIQKASNFERLLFDATEKNAYRVKDLYKQLSENGYFRLSDTEFNYLQEHFRAFVVGDEQIEDTINSVYKSSSIVIDPHTATGVAAAENLSKSSEVIVVLSTAHPGKFPETVNRALGFKTAESSFLSLLMDKKEQFEVVPNNYTVIRNLVLEKAKYSF